MTTAEYVKHLQGLGLTDAQLEAIGMSQGWYNRFQKAAGFTAASVLESLPIIMAAVGFTTAVTEVTVAAGLENAPVDLEPLNHI